MKIIIENAQGANHYIASSYATAFMAAGYDVVWWDTDSRSAFDIFAENSDVELFLAHTWKLNRAVVKNLVKFKGQLRVVLFANHFGPMDKEITEKYAIETSSADERSFVRELLSNNVDVKGLICQYFQKNVDNTHGNWGTDVGIQCHGFPLCADVTQYYLTAPTKDYETDIFYTGGYWPYKAKYLNKYLLPLCYPNSKYKVKIVGSGWSTPNCVGRANENTIRNYYASAKVVPALFEPHTELVGDIPQRVYQVAACGGFQISQPAVDLDLAFDKKELHIFNNEEEFNQDIMIGTCEEGYAVSQSYRKAACLRVYAEHTNFHRSSRLAKLFGENPIPFDMILNKNYETVKQQLQGAFICAD